MHMMTHTEVRAQMERVREQLRAMIAEGRADEAVEMAFTMLLELQHHNIALVLELAKERRQRSGRQTERIDPAQLLLMLDLMVASAEDERADLAATSAEERHPRSRARRTPGRHAVPDPPPSGAPAPTARTAA